MIHTLEQRYKIPSRSFFYYCDRNTNTIKQTKAEVLDITCYRTSCYHNCSFYHRWLAASCSYAPNESHKSANVTVLNGISLSKMLFYGLTMHPSWALLFNRIHAFMWGVKLMCLTWFLSKESSWQHYWGYQGGSCEMPLFCKSQMGLLCHKIIEVPLLSFYCHRPWNGNWIELNRNAMRFSPLMRKQVRFSPTDYSMQDFVKV